MRKYKIKLQIKIFISEITYKKKKGFILNQITVWNYLKQS